ncbi:MAG TPA: hypothetical protein VMT26_04710 [Candidatus Bathyarchaeia archaeon]|nr:hypothetical protein [Candidatus Bathyarchaeia archaeon]
MKARIAVATLSGKAYYLVVSELKKKSIPFLSLTPNEPIPMEIKAVITTENEQQLIRHDRVLVYREGMEPEALINEALQVVQGKEYYERVVIGIDPGEVLGLAVLADGKVIETGNCFSVKDTANKIRSILKNLKRTTITSVSVKIGDGVPVYKEKLLRTLDEALSLDIVLESVSEAGTNRGFSEAKHRRGLRDIVSAIKIAGRNGQIYTRRKTDEQDS